MYLRNGAPAGAGELQELRAAMLEAGETLDTRCRFFSMGDRMYLMRNLLNLRMERFGMLVLGIERDRMFQPLKDLEQTGNAEASASSASGVAVGAASGVLPMIAATQATRESTVPS